jgi:hypothetical protein
MSMNRKTTISTISARGTIIGKRNAGPESRRTNPVWTSKDENHQDCTLRMKNLRSHWFWHLIDLCHHWCKVCVLSLATCSKFFKVLAPGNKVRPRLNVRAGNQTTSWLFDTVAAITCMNSRSFSTAFAQQKPRKISNAQSWVAASRNVMKWTCG